MESQELLRRNYRVRQEFDKVHNMSVYFFIFCLFDKQLLVADALTCYQQDKPVNYKL